MNEETFTDIFDWLNKRRREFAKRLSQELLKQHPTLQQDFVRAVSSVLREYSENTSIDGRNRQAVKYAKEAAKINIALPFI